MPLESLISEMQKQQDNTFLHRAILQEALFGASASDIDTCLSEAQLMQVLLCQPYAKDYTLDLAHFTNMLRITGHAEHSIQIIPLDFGFICVLTGEHIIHTFREYAHNDRTDDSFAVTHNAWIEPLFITCGRIVTSLSEIKASCQDATALMRQRFFHSPSTHILFVENLMDPPCLHHRLSNLHLEEYKNRLMQYVQTFNRALTSEAMQQLQAFLTESGESPTDIRLFCMDLYLQIKEQIKNLYQGHSIPFYSNTYIIQTILEAPTLTDIVCFLAQRLDMIMTAIGASSRDSVLGDIINYIQHNFSTNITLENIAPLFGYNHSYLGKIFRKKMGVSFNEYVDNLRIERAKELLLKDSAKVYTVAEQVGYKNVDYFHVKFRKYVHMSPVEFRKTNCAATQQVQADTLPLK